MRRGAFLDRDGVVNRAILLNGIPRPPSLVEEVVILKGVFNAIEILKAHEYVPVVVTNQPDVARGVTSRAMVEKINSHIGDLTGIDYFYVCMHDEEDFCTCRKPAPGLIIKSAHELGLDISSSFMIGDRWRDVSAGQAAGCRSFFIDYCYPEARPEMPFTSVSSLLEAVGMMTGELHGNY